MFACVACCPLFVVWLFAACWLMLLWFVVCRALLAVRCLLFVVCECLLFVVCCLLCAVCCLLYVACCPWLLFVV